MRTMPCICLLILGLWINPILAAGKIISATRKDDSCQWYVEASSAGVTPDIDVGTSPALSGGGYSVITGNNPFRYASSLAAATRDCSYTDTTARNDLSLIGHHHHTVFPGNAVTTNADGKLSTFQGYQIQLKDPVEKVYWSMRVKADWTTIEGPPSGPAGSEITFGIVSGPRILVVTWEPDNNRWAFSPSWGNGSTTYVDGFDCDKSYTGNYPSPAASVYLGTFVQGDDEDSLATAIKTIGSNNPGHPGEDSREDKVEVWVENRITNLQ